MEKSLIYANIVNSNSLIEFILRVCYACIIINFVMSFFDNKKDNKLKEVKEEETKFGIIELLGCFVLLGLLILLVILLLKYNSFVAFFSIPSMILTIYIVYIKPMIKDENTPFDYDYGAYGTWLTFSLSCLMATDYEDYFSKIQEDGVAQVITIILLLFQIYTSMYCLIMNVYFVIKSLGKFKIEVWFEKYKNILNKLYDFLGMDSVKFSFDLSNEILKKKSKWLIVLYFIIDVLKCFVMAVLSVFFSLVLSPILIFIKYLLSKLIKLTKTNENHTSYGIAKFISIFSIIVVYILLQMNSVFQTRIISVYEFFSTAILIPLILDSLINFRKKLNS